MVNMEQTLTAKTRRVLPYELVLGQALPWTLYDEAGNLLLREGYVIAQQRHLDALLIRGAYIREAITPDELEEGLSSNDVVPAQPLPFSTEPVVPRCLKLLQNLERLHADLEEGDIRTDMRMLIQGMAHVIEQVCNDDPEAVLYVLHTNRAHGYLVHQQLLGAVLVELLAKQADVNPSLRTSWVCAALTRDIGMIDMRLGNNVDDSLLQQQVREHPIYSVAMLTRMRVNDPVWLQVVREHQERCDGSGYPHHLLKDAICEGARLLGVVDSYAAMVVPRSNRVARAPKFALQAIYAEKDTAYDVQWVQRLVKELTLYPPGSLVKLQTGDWALLAARQNNPKALQVWVVKAASGALQRPAVPRSTSDDGYALQEAVVLEPAALEGIDIQSLRLAQIESVARASNT